MATEAPYAPKPDRLASESAGLSTTLAIVGLSGIALVLRVVVAGNGGLWRDEALFLAIVQLPSIGEMIDFLRNHESHPPLFYMMMRAWLSVAGDSAAAARSVPILLGVVMIPAIYAAGRSLFSERVALIAAALASISPALTEYSAVVRPYSLLPLLALGASWTLIRGLERGGVLVWGSHALCTLALLYTHNWSWVVVMGHSVAAVAVILYRPASRWSRLREWTLAQTVVALGYLPWAPSFLDQLGSAGHAPFVIGSGVSNVLLFGVLGVREVLISTILADVLDVDVSLGATARALIPVALAGTIMSIAWSRIPATAGYRTGPGDKTGASTRASRGESVALLLIATVSAAFVAIAFSLRSNLLVSGCMTTLAPALLLLLSAWLVRQRGGAFGRLSAPILLVLVITYSLSLGTLLVATRSNARELAAVVTREIKESDLVILAPGWLASSFNRYYSGTAEQIVYPDFGRRSTFDYQDLGRRLANPETYSLVRERIAAAARNGHRVWLVMDQGDLKTVAPEDLAKAVTSSHYGTVASARTNQLRNELMAQFGTPLSFHAARGKDTPIENLVASRYGSEP